MILPYWLDNSEANNLKKMDSLQRQKKLKQRYSSPNVIVTPFKMSQSIVGDQFDLSSPTTPLKIQISNFDMAKNTSLQQNYQWRQQSQTKAQCRINPSERQLISHLARIFITQQYDKPQKVIIRIKEMPSSPGSKQDKCRLQRFQISRIDRHNQEYIQDEEGGSINPFFSFSDIPEISKILVSQHSASPNKNQLKSKQFIENQRYSQVSSPKKSQIKLNENINRLKSEKTVDLRYKPYPKAAYYSKFKAKNEPSSEFSSKISSQFSPSKDCIQPKADTLEPILFTKLVQLDMVLTRSSIQQKSQYNRQRLRAVTLQQYEHEKKKYNDLKENISAQVSDLKKEKDKKNKEIEQLMNLNNTLKQEIKRLKEKIDKMQTIQKRILQGSKKTEEQLNSAKITIKMLKRQLCARESHNYSQINSSEANNFGSMKTHQKEEVINNPSPKKKEQNNKQQYIATKMLPTTNNYNHTEKETVALQRNHYQQQITAKIQSNNRQLNTLVQSHLYDHIANPLVQQEIKNFKANQISRRPQNMVGIRKNPVSREVTPSQSREILRTNRSAGRIEHFNRDSDSDNKSYSICSNLSKRSLYQKIGYVKKQRQNPTHQSILQDYMLRSHENGDFESQVSQLKKPTNASQKSRLKYKASK